MSVSALLIVFANPVDGAEEEFNHWYTNTHSPDIVKLGVAVSFTRYECSGIALLPGIPEPGRYAVIYEIKAENRDQIQQAVQTLQAGLEAGETDISPSMDFKTVQAAWLLPITEHIVGDPRNG